MALLVLDILCSEEVLNKNRIRKPDSFRRAQGAGDSKPAGASLTNEPVIELFFAVALPGIGAAILFNLGSSTGGTDIIAMILKRKTNINIGQALLVTDIILTLLTFHIRHADGLLSVADCLPSPLGRQYRGSAEPVQIPYGHMRRCGRYL